MRSAVASLLSIACLTYCSFILSAQAQDLGAEQLKKFIVSDTHKYLVARAFAHVPPDVFQRCPTLVSKGSNITIIRPVSFRPDGRPNTGAWRESFPVSGCGNDTTFHIYFFVNKDEKIDTFVAVPGETRADPTLQKDALVYAMLGATSAAKTCKTFNVKNSRFDGLDTANNKIRSWRETWTMVGCNRTFDVPLTFSPSDRGGTDITQSVSGVVERPAAE
jgi:hypothetical protein